MSVVCKAIYAVKRKHKQYGYAVWQPSTSAGLCSDATVFINPIRGYN